MEGDELTVKEKQLWDQIGDEVLASDDIKMTALQYYIQYRSYLDEKQSAYTKAFGSVQISNLLRVAYFLSQKKQETYNVKGQKINAIALSVNGIMKKTVDFQAFLCHLKQMTRVATINDTHLSQEIQAFNKKFSFTLQFNKKFIKTFPKIKSILEESKLQQSLLWLLFIYAKKNIIGNQREIIQTTALMASLFIYYVQQKIDLNMDDIKLSFDDNNYGGQINKQNVQHVFLEYFKLKDMNMYEPIAKRFKDLLKDISPKKSIFSPGTLEASYKNIDKIYQKRLTIQCIDQRHFLKDRINTVLNANKFTPFGGKRNVAKVKTTDKSKIMSHKFLNFQKHDENDDQETESSSGQVFMKNLKLVKTPYTNLIKMTPLTLTMQMHNWILQKSNYYKFNPNQLPKFFTMESSISQKSQKMIHGLWKDICSIISQEVQLSLKEKQIYLVLAMQIVFYVNHSNSYPIQQIIKIFGISWFQLWSKIDSVLKYNDKMPRDIKFHLLNLQTTIVTTYLWKLQSKLFLIFKQEGQLRKTNPQYERLYKRIIHELVYQLYFLAKKLNLEDDVINKIFQVSQYVINQIPQLCINRNLNHAMLCSLFAICKAQNLEQKFANFLPIFRDLNNYGNDAYEQIVSKIPFQGDFINIIDFYNKIFIKKVKGFIVKIKEGNIDTNKNYIKEPVKQLLSNNVVSMVENITMTPGNQTPFSQKLRAYNQSPLFVGKKVQQGLGKFLQRQINLQKKQISSKEDSISTAKNMISNKFATTKIKSPDARTTKKKL